MWIDKTTYWAWVGKSDGTTPVPSKKVLGYAYLVSKRARYINGPTKGLRIRGHLCVSITENGITTLVHQEELLNYPEYNYMVLPGQNIKLKLVNALVAVDDAIVVAFQKITRFFTGTRK